jgi:hypothetical protein
MINRRIECAWYNGILLVIQFGRFNLNWNRQLKMARKFKIRAMITYHATGFNIGGSCARLLSRANRGMSNTHTSAQAQNSFKVKIADHSIFKKVPAIILMG